jgi:hypothetical protein
MQLLEVGTLEQLGLTLTDRLPRRVNQALGARLTPSPSVGFGISLSLNKRLSSDKTRQLLEWKPKRADILNDISTGSYTAGN